MAAMSSLRSHIKVSDDLSDVLIAKPKTAIIKGIGPLIIAVQMSCQSALILTEHKQYRDALVAARTIFLTVVTVCFMCAEGEATAQRAFRHAGQKAYRDLDQHATVNGISLFQRWEGNSEIPQEHKAALKDAVEEFTSGKGREKNWTDESLAKQLDSIARKYGDRLAGFLAFARLFIHRHASEIAHGSLFSMWWYLGFTVPGEYAQVSGDFELITRDKAVNALFILNFCVYTMIAVVSKEYSQEQFERRSDAILRELITIFTPGRRNK
jgi:hypothetical protein